MEAPETVKDGSVPSGAVGPAEPVTGLMVAKPPPILPDAVHAAAFQ